jgi:hypothetical protein
MSFDLGTGITAVNTILAEEANRIGSDIYSRTLHTSPWLDLTKQTAFADGMGYQQTTLVYDRAVATTTTGGGTVGANWENLGTLSSGGNQFDTSLSGASAQPLDDAADDVQGGRGTGSADKRAFIQFGKQLKKYNLQRAVIESPRISLEDLRFAAHRQEQLRAIMDIMTQVTRNTWENRYREEFEKVSANLTCCLAAGSVTRDTVDADSDNTSDDAFEGSLLTGLDLANSGSGNADITPDANVSNAVLDSIYYKLIRAGAGANAYGRENGRPVFGLVLSSEASYQLQTEAGFRDDVRYNNAKVSDLIAPLGIEKSFRGFYHLIDDLAPRFSISTGAVTKVEPYNVSGGVATPNAAYETASYEAAFVVHPEVCEAQIPNPLSGSNGLTFDPVNYRGKFDWKNIANEITNPDGTIGFFRGVLASATKPIKTEFGYVILFKRDSSTPAA